ncbi:hypothetical protein [Novosphingobium album (ex Liu et al. 2023)]|uniref:Uncharacterized protein n=1 Tax=Novosphingobium album (ex Liu et al. 2023) TaxID=3031130 RepID=A0ABT5WYI5_9SPHN|nr:hypothetical protein [Novosphingobium album (ex Liu et al. 2023)]MDE8654803.1 hypothetical protein [Novosphingobium album (ex Liu et al. 2023)]
MIAGLFEVCRVVALVLDFLILGKIAADGFSPRRTLDADVVPFVAAFFVLHLVALLASEVRA